jgi:HEPN domain-containing protein
MSGPDPARQRDEAKAWLAKADEDLAAVRACLDAKPALLGVAAYHCQQAAEKLIKGLLVLAATPFRNTHDLDELSHLAVPIYPDAEPLLAHLRVRTYWGFAFRYPMPVESEGTRQLPTAEEIEETLRHLSDLRARLAAAPTPDGGRDRRVRPGGQTFAVAQYTQA